MKKTDERKENQTNALRMWMDHMAKRLKGRSLYILVGSAVLVIGAILIYRYYRNSINNANSELNMALYTADDLKKLDEIINNPKNQGTNALVFAKLQKARLNLYSNGIEKLGTTNKDEYNNAIKNIEDGRQLCKDIVNELKNIPALQQGVWIHFARAEEALLGTPKESNPAEYRGSFDAMLTDYQNAAAINPDSDVSKGYAATAAKLKEQRAEMEKVSRELYTLNFAGDLKIQEPGVPQFQRGFHP